MGWGAGRGVLSATGPACFDAGLPSGLASISTATGTGASTGDAGDGASRTAAFMASATICGLVETALTGRKGTTAMLSLSSVDGAAAGAQSIFGVILGTGCGGGIVIGGRLIDGPRGIGGEWGHNPLPWPGAEVKPCFDTC